MTGMSQYSAHAVHSNSSISDAVESKSTIYDWSQNTVEPYSTICDCSYYGPRAYDSTSRMPYGTGSPKPVSSPNPTSQNVSAYRAGGESKGTETT